MRQAIVLAAVVLVLVLSSSANSLVPETISYQGVLRDESGELVVDGTYTMTFWLYAVPSGGSDLWQETKPVSVQDGVFNVHLGDVVPLSSLTFTDPYWLAIGVEGEPMMVPRTQLDSVPYALHAMTALEAGDDGDWAKSDYDLYRSIGRVGIRTIPLFGNLEVAGFDDETALYVNHYDTGLSARFRGGNVQVEEVLEVGGFVMPTGAVDGYVLTSDASGVGTWQAGGAGGDDGDWIRPPGSSMHAGVSGNVGIGTTVPTAKLEVSAPGSGPAGVFSASGLNDSEAALFVQSYESLSGGERLGVHALSMGSEVDGIGGRFEGSYRGVEGIVEPIGFEDYTGVYGSVQDGYGTNVGVHGYATGTYATCFGVVGEVDAGYAGYFAGDVYVLGELDAITKSFRIDHPLDPSGMYLRHACVESDERKNVYDGVAELDADGTSRVTLPRWFEALNGSFRYQLTCIGGFAPVYIAEKIENGSFVIAGGEPGMEVCWQVTGVRQDAYARANEFAVELEKTGAEEGTYLTPELHGAPGTARLYHHELRGKTDASDE